MAGNEGFRIYINENAGTVQSFGIKALENLISDSHLGVDALYFLSPDKLCSKLSDHDDKTPILIGGGDGTLRSCAATLMKKERPFGILPLGTMNLLATDLGIPTALHEAIAAYAKGVTPMKMDAGMVNDKEIFLCCASLGTMPEASEYREKHRNDSQPLLIPRLTAYILKQMDRMNRRKLILTLDGKKKKIETSALVVANNRYAPQEEWTGDNFKRASVQDGILGIYSAAPYSFWDRVRFLLRLQTGGWKKDDALQEWSAEKLGVQTKERSALLSVDGETLRMNMPLDFTVKPKALEILLPRL